MEAIRFALYANVKWELGEVLTLRTNRPILL